MGKHGKNKRNINWRVLVDYEKALVIIKAAQLQNRDDIITTDIIAEMLKIIRDLVITVEILEESVERLEKTQPRNNT